MLSAFRRNPVRLASDSAPEEVRDRIERLFGGPYLELFGRKRVDGWTLWGNEIPREDFPNAAK